MAPRKHKTEFNTKTGSSASLPTLKRNSVEFDPAEFTHFLEETDWTDEQKSEYATLVWNIVCEFVAMGFGVHPIQQAQNACGKHGENLPAETELGLDSLRSYLQENHSDLASPNAGSQGK